MDISKQTKSTIKFVKPSIGGFKELEPKKEINTYYQICQFKSKFTKKYQTRKIIFNEYNEIIKIFEREYNFDELNYFMKHHRQNKYKLYPYDDISNIEMPSSVDIICCKSELLNNDNNEFGYGKFESDNSISL